jgi:hypothetical protein
MTQTKRKRYPKRLAALLKPVRRKNIHPELGLKKSAPSLSVEPSQMTILRRLARERGTTVEQEIDHAIDTYLSGISPQEVRMLNTILDRFRAKLHKKNQAIDAAQREIEQSNARLARLKKRRRSRPR